jgi:SAM-dependent methyltransferase
MNRLMPDQAHFWSRAATFYEREFIDPFRPDARNPLLQVLGSIKNPHKKVIADLGCGIGPLLPYLAARFLKVLAVDFAEGMLERARSRCPDATNIEFLPHHLTDLGQLACQADVALAVNSLIMPSLQDIDTSLLQIQALLKPGGVLMGIVPAIDSVHYYTILLVDRALADGKPLDVARKNAAHFNDHSSYDFAFGQFHFQGIEQHFWQPYEVRYRLRKAGFPTVRLRRVFLAWEQFSAGRVLAKELPPWDWFFHARKTRNRR